MRRRGGRVGLADEADRPAGCFGGLPRRGDDVGARLVPGGFDATKSMPSLAQMVISEWQTLFPSPT